MSFGTILELTAKSQEDLNEILADVRILCRSMGITFEQLPSTTHVEQADRLISGIIHDADCCAECEENTRVN